jgi:hypothetical protein
VHWAFRDDTLLFLEGNNSLVKIGSKICVVRVSERELEFRLLCVFCELCGKVSMFTKKRFVTTNGANNDAVEWDRSVYVTIINSKDMGFSSGPFTSSDKAISRRILRK